MGGPNRQEQDRQRAMTEEQLAVGRDWLNFAKEDRAKRDTLMDPVLKRNEAILKSRDSQLQTVAPQVGEVSTQFETVKRQMEADPQMSGAVKDAALAQASQNKASAIAKFLNDSYLNALNNQANLASGYGNFSLGESGTGLRGYGQAGDANNMLMQQQAQKLASWLNFGSGLAGAAGTAFGKGCWIAEAVYGADDPRTTLARLWLNGPFRESTLGDCTMRLYLLAGRQVAWLVCRSRLLRRAFKPLFDRAVRKAMEFGR